MEGFQNLLEGSRLRADTQQEREAAGPFSHVDWATHIFL